MTLSLIDTRDAQRELESILHLETGPADDPVRLRLAAISLELEALETTRTRLDPRAAGPIVELKLADLRRRMAELALDVLGYYGLPEAGHGENEPPPGKVYARDLKSRHLDHLAHDELSLSQIKDALADYLVTLT